MELQLYGAAIVIANAMISKKNCGEHKKILLIQVLVDEEEIK